MPLFWMSFADPKKRPGTQFLGVAIVEADNFDRAIRQAWAKGINPGGEIQSAQLDADADALIPQDYRNRLLSRADCEALDALIDSTKH